MVPVHDSKPDLMPGGLCVSMVTIVDYKIDPSQASFVCMVPGRDQGTDPNVQIVLKHTSGSHSETQVAFVSMAPVHAYRTGPVIADQCSGSPSA